VPPLGVSAGEACCAAAWHRGCFSRGVVTRIRRSSQHGYTLVELMAVVCIMGVLATMAVYGVRKYVLSAKTSEPLEIINSVRAAQEAYKDETFGYLDVSPMTSYYPFLNKGDLGTNQKKTWVSGNSGEQAKWDQLGVHPSAAVQFGYACAGGKGNNVPTQGSLQTTKDLGYPSSAPDWYVVRAAGDRDGNGVLALFVGSNFTDEIYGENDTE
jgi:type IV pilus assembly protein PilA